MTNEELRTLAAIGVPQRILEMEHELKTYYREWPHLFVRAPELLAALATQPSNGNGHKPAVAAPPDVTTEATAPPKRRRRKMSRKARAAISAAQKARWAKAKKRAANA